MKAVATTKQKGIIAWFAANHVAANLLMLFIIAAGIISAFTIRKQTTPDFELNTIQVRVAYLGAAPQEVEEGVVIKIEEAIQDVKGIVKLTGRAGEGIGSVTAEVSSDTDIDEVLSEIKTRVDAISTFPGLTEKPVIFKEEVPIHVVFVAVHGSLDEFSRKAIAQEVRDDLMQLPAVSTVQFLGDRPYEISIEVSENVLRQYGLTMSEVSQAVRNSSVDMPGGTINSERGDISLRTEGQVYTGREFASLVLRTFPDGTRLTLGDIATITDGFVEEDGYGRFDGERTATLRVLASGEQNELSTAAAVQNYVDAKRMTLPDGVRMDIWIDRSHYLKGRLRMMTSNMWQGAMLVFILLSLFLRIKVAAWVVLGIPITFLGAMWLMPLGPWPVTINMMSLFGFIIVLGIVVDDAIIIGESIYTKVRAEGHSLDNVILGAKRVALPATFGVLTTIAAFAPLLFVGGIAGPFFEAISVVVVLCLMFSLVESKLILPAHLVHTKIEPVDEEDLFNPQRHITFWHRIPRFFLKIQRHVQHGLQNVIHHWYRPMVERAVDNRGLTTSLFVAMLILTAGVMASGIVKFEMFPEQASDFIRVELQMQTGSAPDERDRVLSKLEDTVLEMNSEYVEANPGSLPMIRHVGAFTRSETGGIIFVELPQSEDRPFNGDEISNRWRERAGEFAGVKELTFSDADHFGGGPPLSFRLSGKNYEALEAAAAELAAELSEYEGVFDIRDTFDRGGDEIRLRIKPEAEALGLTMSSLGRQVRQAFYGEEAQRIQRGQDELKVMVRYPPDERRSIADLENMRIRTLAGDEVPFSSVADMDFGEGYSSISRLNRKRTITVSADIDPEIVESKEIVKSISEEYVPALLSRHPGVSYGLEGASQELVDLQRNLSVASVAALFLIYALIAIPLRSYSQPLVIMSVIPFGVIGAVIGHIVMGRSLSMFSLFGLVALAGVVVNDSLIMIDFINKARAAGASLKQSVIDSGTRRFRAIILTSFTTAAGLMPIMTEGSLQAQTVIPMAISLSFGIIFATVITLFLIPCLYMLQEDGFKRGRQFRNWLLGRTPHDEETQAHSASFDRS
ncbi:MAG: efflux RND transporter permease subunit [Gammaproteobacteria bacterium]|nr:efflux RND transporter permease subunit [Gammaproteobacteria bacterium]NND47964.1 efflux RND transporter permease subunit [Woeseiaceae bacterium]NNL45745.1 efflux RND transporter permease subunit [Woeseiaceae bacterium]